MQAAKVKVESAAVTWVAEALVGVARVGVALGGAAVV